MKKIFSVLSIFIINFLGLLAGFFLYKFWTEDIILKTKGLNGGLHELILFVLIFAGVIIYTTYKNVAFKKYGIGIIAVSIAVILHLFFSLNMHFAFEGNHASHKLLYLNKNEGEFYLNVSYNSRPVKVQVTLEKYLRVDSVHIRVDEGLFGFEVLSNNVRIMQSQTCNNTSSMREQNPKYYSRIGDSLVYQRCFFKAIENYNKCLEIDSMDFLCRYYRGNMRMALKEYRDALIDFYKIAILRYSVRDNSGLDSTSHSNKTKLVRELLLQVDRHDLSDVHSFVHAITDEKEDNLYTLRMNYCLNHLKD